MLVPGTVTSTKRSPSKWDSWATAEAVESARAVLRNGGVVVLVDALRGRADLIAAGSLITPAVVNTMATNGRGLSYLSLSAERVDRLRLPPMARTWNVPRKPFTVSVEARNGVTTGISATDRAHTIRVATAPDARVGDLVSPGHVFPLRARPGGFGPGAGSSEAALELVQGATAADTSDDGAAMTEVLDEAGGLASLSFVALLGDRLGFPIVAIEAVVSASSRPGLPTVGGPSVEEARWP